MYGGKIDSTGNVTNELRVFHIHNESWVLLTPKAKEQYAVVGHSAHIVTLATWAVWSCWSSLVIAHSMDI